MKMDVYGGEYKWDRSPPVRGAWVEKAGQRYQLSLLLVAPCAGGVG